MELLLAGRIVVVVVVVNTVVVDAADVMFTLLPVQIRLLNSPRVKINSH